MDEEAGRIEQQIFELLDRREPVAVRAAAGVPTAQDELDELDHELDALYRELDAARGVAYVPRFRNHETLSALKLHELAEVVRRLANGRG